MKRILFTLMTLVSVMAFGQSEIQGDKPEEMEEFAQGYELADVDALPGFPGGPAKRSEFIKDHLRIPFGKEGCKKSEVRGLVMKVYVAFNIEKDGRLTDIRIMRGCPVDCINEAVLKVVKEMPKFNPGIRKGDPVKVKQVILPVSLKL